MSIFTIHAQQEDATKTLLSPDKFKYTEEAVEAIKFLESYQDKIYYDNNDNLIFGYGHLVTEKDFAALKNDFGYESQAGGTKQFIQPINKLTSDEKRKIIEEYLRKDMNYVIDKLKKNITIPLEQYRIDALVIYLFWRGANEQNLDVFELYELINKKDHNAVADFIKNRPKKDKTYLPGNRKRNAQNANLYSTGEYPYWF